MKKTYPTTPKMKGDGWVKHLRKAGKRRANKGTRKILRREATDLADGQ